MEGRDILTPPKGAVLGPDGARSRSPGAVEITQLYLMPLTIFLVAASLQRRGGNVNVDLLKRRFPTARRR